MKYKIIRKNGSIYIKRRRLLWFTQYASKVFSFNDILIKAFVTPLTIRLEGGHKIDFKSVKDAVKELRKYIGATENQINFAIKDIRDDKWVKDYNKALSSLI